MCPFKYCIVPQGRLRNVSWDVQRVTGLPCKRMLRSTDVGFIHCHQVSTNWKALGERRGVSGNVDSWQGLDMTCDSKTRALLVCAISFRCCVCRPIFSWTARHKWFLAISERSAHKCGRVQLTGQWHHVGVAVAQVTRWALPQLL
jgi:hypothetical protein